MTDKLNLCIDWKYFDTKIVSLKPLVLDPIDTLDKEKKQVRYNPAYLLFIMHYIPETRYFNNTNYALKSQEVSKKKRALDYKEAKITQRVCSIPENKNDSMRTSAVIIAKFEDEDYNKCLEEYNTLSEERDAYKNLSEYHKDLSFLIQTELKINGVIDDAEKELIK